MKKELLTLFLLFATLLSGGFLFAQEQIINKSALPNDIVNQKIAFLDSVRKENNFKHQKEQQDHIYYKSLTEQGYTRRQVDSLHKVADPNFIVPAYSPSADETGVHTKFQNQNSNNEKNNNLNPPPVVLTTGPEQDCINGIQVCQTSYTQSTSYTGYGTVQEVYNTCLLSDETYSVWYIFTCTASGTFGFNIVTSHDYDWALYDLTAIGGCSNVPTSTPVRCNYSGTYGNTGLTLPGATELPPIGINAAGVPTESGISNMVAGTTYALMVNNYSLDAMGYTISFAVGTAVITDNVAPTISSAVNNCNNTVTLNFSKAITEGLVVGHPNIAASLDADGSDFNITPAGFTWTTTPVGAGNMVSSALLHLTGTPTSGVYTITVKTGNDGNTLLDHCGNIMPIGTAITFNYLAPVVTSVAPTSICAGASSNLSSNNIPGAAYTWSPSGSLSNPNIFNPVATPNSTTNYQCSINYGGCTSLSASTLTVVPTPVASISPMNPILCSGTANLIVSGSNCNNCAYVWSTGATTSSISVGTGVYTATVSSSGCPSTAVTSSVTITSSGTGCNIYYVAPTASGAGDGSTPANAATIQNAVAAAGCGSTIKMEVGIYTLTAYLPVSNNITIEGGFNSTFTTKTSDMSTGNATTLRRSNTPDACCSGASVSCFQVAAGASYFRFQDLRIEMPGSANVTANPAGSNQTNYGIKLGAGCNNYNIVRCYIDGGVGSN